MREVTQVFGYYDQPKMLAFNLGWHSVQPKIVKNHWRIAVVDDGSPESPAALNDQVTANVDIYRIGVDVPWNDKGARNIGVHEALSPWVLVTDIDHLVPVRTAEALINGAYSKQTVYSFGRVEWPCMKRIHPHPNSFFLHKTLWDKIGGCDERLSGCYGGDAEWRGRAMHIAGPVKELPLDLIQVTTDTVPDAWITTMARKTPGNTERRAAILRQIKDKPGPLTMSFPYERAV